MNKYDRCFNRVEKASLINDAFAFSWYNLLCKIHLGKNNAPIDMTYGVPLISVLLPRGNIDSEKLKWIKEVLFPKLNTKYFLSEAFYYLMLYSYYNKEEREKLMALLVEMELLQSIEYKEHAATSTFDIKTPDGKNYRIIRAIPDINEFLPYRRYCHDVVFKGLKDNNNFSALSGCFSTFDSLFGNLHFHSFLLCDGLVYDLSRNIMTEPGFYFDELRYHQELLQSSGEIIDGISKLESSDPDFRKSELAPFLKYSINMRMKRR